MDRIIGYLGVSLNRGDVIEILGKICPIFEDLGIEKSKEKFVTDRDMESRKYLKSKGVEINKDFNLEKCMKKYIFW